ncbi:MAG: hypothetical protein AB7E32_08055 [Desulfovibrio sp.]
MPATTRDSSLAVVDLRTRRTWAKVGMATSLGMLVATGLMGTDRYPQMKKLHLWSGFALVGFSYWHYSLYNASPARGAKP